MAATILVMPWQYKKADELLDIANRKGFEVERAVLKNHWRLTGPDGDLARRRRAYELMESFFKRVSAEQMRLSLIAVYNGAKPVVVDTRDADVVRNFLKGVDMNSAFDIGKTHLFAGLAAAAQLAEDGRSDSTTVVLLTDVDEKGAAGILERLLSDFRDNFPAPTEPAVALGYYEVAPGDQFANAKRVLPRIFSQSPQSH